MNRRSPFRLRVCLPFVFAGALVIQALRDWLGFDRYWLAFLIMVWYGGGWSVVLWIWNKPRGGATLFSIEATRWRRKRLSIAVSAPLVIVGFWAAFRLTSDTPPLLWCFLFGTLATLYGLSQTPRIANVRETGLACGIQFWPWDYFEAYEWDGDSVGLRFWGGWMRWHVGDSDKSRLDALLKRHVPAART